MPRWEAWGFVSLIGCLVTVSLSLSLLAGTWQAVGCVVGALFGIFSGGLYAASVAPRSPAEVEPNANAGADSGTK
jgi:hypothetical protein